MPAPYEIPIPGPAADFGAALSAQLPVIETERLRLRAPRLEDFAFYAEIVTTPRGRYILEDRDRDAAWLDFAQMVAAWLLRGHGLWTVEARGAAEVLGFVLICLEPGDHEPELGYVFREIAEGHGYAAEAARAARIHAREVMALPSLVSTIDPDNTRSRRLAERLGATRDPQAEAAHDNAILVYRHPMQGADAGSRARPDH